ncbi:MAG: hypothetical protein Q9195_004958 [Heterodermia aff. obscurata]
MNYKLYYQSLVVVVSIKVASGQRANAHGSREQRPTPVYAVETKLAVAISLIDALKRFAADAGKSHPTYGGPMLPFQVCREKAFRMRNPKILTRHSQAIALIKGIDLNAPEVRPASDQPDVRKKHADCSAEEIRLSAYALPDIIAKKKIRQWLHK